MLAYFHSATTETFFLKSQYMYCNQKLPLNFITKLVANASLFLIKKSSAVPRRWIDAG